MARIRRVTPPIRKSAKPTSGLVPAGLRLGAAAPAASFAVILVDAGANKLNVVKVVKTVTGLGLKEAKDLVDAAPSTIKEHISSDEAEAIKAQLVESGATVTVR